MQSQAQTIQTGQITFLSEQDGEIERELKTAWVDYFKRDIHVTLACLARVRYANSAEERVALCVRADRVERKTFIEHVSSDFKKVFRRTETLDIIFLTPDQQSRLFAVARPFYEQSAHQT